MEINNCPKCQGIRYLKEGISPKNNKPYAGWKCRNCGDMEFIKRNPMAGIQKEEDQGDAILRGLKLIEDNLVAGFEVINNNIKALIQKLDK